MALRDAFNQFMSGRDAAAKTLADLQQQLDTCDEDAALARSDHATGKLTIDEAASKVALVKARREYLADLILAAEEKLAAATAADHAKAHEKELAAQRKLNKASLDTLTQHLSKLKSVAPKVDAALKALADALEDMDGPAQRAALVYPWDFDFPWLVQGAALDAGLGDVLGIIPRISYANGTSSVDPDYRRPEFDGIEKEIAADCDKALADFSLALGLTERPALPPSPPPPPAVYIDPDAAKRRADAELARMQRDAGRARPDLGEIPPTYESTGPRVPNDPTVPQVQTPYQPPVEQAPLQRVNTATDHPAANDWAAQLAANFAKEQ